MPKEPSKGEIMLALHLRAAKIRGWVAQYRFHSVREWTSDFAFPIERILIEVEGGVFSKGRHTRGKGFTEDCVKYNEALLLGWRVLRVTTAQVKMGMALVWIERALKSEA